MSPRALFTGALLWLGWAAGAVASEKGYSNCPAETLSCGGIAVYVMSSILSDTPINNQEIEQSLGGKGKQASLLDLSEFLTKKGLSIGMYRCELEDVVSFSPPFIAHLALPRPGRENHHFTTVVETHPDRGVCVIDPMFARETEFWMSWKEFEHVFQGNILSAER